MSHFYGTVQGHRGEATRAGSKDSGIETYAASWHGAVHAALSQVDEHDVAHVGIVPWQGRGERVTLYTGPMGADRVATLRHALQTIAAQLPDSVRIRVEAVISEL
jgi:hypothetical protein